MRVVTLPLRRVTAVAVAGLVLGACGGDPVEPAAISGSELMVRGLGNTTAADRADSCEGMRLAGADLLVESMLAGPDVPDDIAATDPEDLADTLAAFCEELATG